MVEPTVNEFCVRCSIGQTNKYFFDGSLLSHGAIYPTRLAMRPVKQGDEHQVSGAQVTDSEEAGFEIDPAACFPPPISEPICDRTHLGVSFFLREPPFFKSREVGFSRRQVMEQGPSWEPSSLFSP